MCLAQGHFDNSWRLRKKLKSYCSPATDSSAFSDPQTSGGCVCLHALETHNKRDLEEKSVSKADKHIGT